MPESKEKKALQKGEMRFISFQPLIQISQKTIYITKNTYLKIKRIIHPQLLDFSEGEKMKKDQKETKKSQLEWGLDCSGQGECQPNIDHSDDQELHEFFEKAEHKKEHDAIKKEDK